MELYFFYSKDSIFFIMIRFLIFHTIVSVDTFQFD